MAIDYKTLRWDDIVRQAQNDHSRQWGEKDTFDPFSSGMTNIAGRGAQIYAPNLDWSNASFNLNNPEDPNQPLKHMTRLSRGDDGGVKVDYYGMNRGMPVGLAAVLAAPFAAAALGLGAGGAVAGEAAASGASGLLGTGAAGAGELAAAAGGAYSIPTAAELAAFGADVGGMGLTGTGGIGAASSVAGAGAGAAGTYGAAAGGGVLNSLSSFLSNPLTQVGTSLLNGVITNRAANKAADVQTEASQAAIGEQRRQYDQTRADLAPWRDRGASAANRLAVMMKLAGDQSDPYYGKGMVAAPRYPGSNAFSRFVNRG